MHEHKELTRRQFITYTAAGAAGLMLPAVGEAGVWSWIGYAVRLQPTRLIAGLIFDIGKAVVVSLVADAIVNNLSSRHYSRLAAAEQFGSSTRSLNAGSLSNETNFKPVPYKASVITLGVADYELHPQRKIKMELHDAAEIQRFQTVLQYLQHEQIRIQFGKMEYAKPADKFRELEPDDLLTLTYWDLAGEQERHVQQLVAETKVSAFNHLAV